MGQAISQFFKSPYLGVVVFVIGAIWTGWIFVGPPIGLARTDRWAYAAWVALGAFVSGGYAVFRLIRENLGLKERLKPKAMMVFDSALARTGNLQLGQKEYRYGVGIISLSDVSITGMRLMLQGSEPDEAGVTYLNMPLGDSTRGVLDDDGIFTLHPGNKMLKRTDSVPDVAK